MWLSFFLLVVSSLTAYEVQILSMEPKIYYIEHFLSDWECDYMVAAARPYLQPSTVVDDHRENGSKLDSSRTSQGMFFPQLPLDPVLRHIELRISDLTHLPRENGEGIQVLWYPTGAQYRPHYDFFDPQTVGGASCLNRGGQRVATLIMYLNTPLDGGETIFPRVSLKVQPKKGAAVLFYSCTPAGSTDPLTLHGGAPVKAGEKWIATKWIRMQRFY